MSIAALDNNYRNNLLNVELNQTPDNRVSVLLVFEHPYTDPVKVVYKAENEYNILLPETYHSITSINTANTLNIRSASAKLIPYFDNETSNGYTKITLKTTRPVIFNAHASYVTTKFADTNLLKELEKDPPKTITTSTVQQKTTPKTQAQQTKKTTPTVAKKATQKQQPKKVATQKKTTTTIPKKQVNKQKTINKPATVQKSQPIHVTQTNEVAKTSNLEVKKPFTEPEPIIVPTKPLIVETEPKQIQKELTKEEKLLNLINNTLENDNAMLSILIFASSLLLLMLFKVSRKQQIGAQTTSQKSKLKYKEVYPNTDIPNEIKNMSWQEKFKYMKEKENSFRKGKSEEVISNEIYNAYNEENDIAPQYDEDNFNKIIEQTQPVSNPFMQDSMNSNSMDISIEEPTILPQADLDELSDISDIEPVVDRIYQKAPDKESLEVDVDINEDYEKPYVEPTLINQAKISKTKGFYLIRYENEVALVGYIKDKIFFIHSFNEISQSFVQTRLTEKKRGADIYLVRSDNYKALVSVSKDEMKPLITL